MVSTSRSVKVHRMSSRGRWLAAAALVVGVVLRLGVCWLRDPGMYRYSDMGNYDQVAEHVLKGSLWPRDTFYPIGYPAFLAALYTVGSSRFLVVSAVQALLGILTCVLVCALTWKTTTSEAASVGAALASSVYPPFIYYGSLLLTEAIAPFFLTLHVYLLLRMFERPSVFRCAAAGVVLSLATTIRPNFLLLYPFVCLATWTAFPPHAWIRWKAAGLTLFFALPMLALVSINNSWLVGRPTGLSTNGGVNFYLMHTDVRGLTFFDEWLSPIRNFQRFKSWESSAVPLYDEPHFYRAGFERFRARDDKVAHLLDNVAEGFGLGGQAYWPANLTRSVEDPNRLDHWWERHMLRWSSRIFVWLLVLPIGVEGAILAARRTIFQPSESPRLLACLMIVVLGLTFSTLLADPRVHVPFDALLIVFTADAFTRMSRVKLIARGE